MALNHHFSRGDIQRVLAEIRAQLPPGYDPVDDHWAAPFDCDACTEALNHLFDPETPLVRGRRPSAGQPPERQAG